jgi:type I restriction enzyme R subunit
MRNEAQTRFELIDPMLIDHCGWRRQDIRVEQTAAQIDIVAGKGYRRPAGRTDYLLFRALSEGSEPIPLAIIEAKHEGLPPEHGLQQGKPYQRGKLHHVPFVFSSNGHQFVEYNEKSGITSEAVPMSEFPIFRGSRFENGFTGARNANHALRQGPRVSPLLSGRRHSRSN